MAEQRRKIGAFGAALLVAVVAEPSSSVAQERPKIGLALAGGGAAGLAHVGVIRELEDLGLRPDCVTGTSMGALVAGLYASGYSADELEAAVRDIDWPSILDDSADRSVFHPARRDTRSDPLSTQARLPLGLGQNGPVISGGLVDGVKFSLILRDLTERVGGVSDFDALPLPFRAVATDLETGDEVVLGDGDIALAMRASASIPGLFPPTEIGERILIDGGVVNNLPIEAARELCGDVVIAVDLPAPEPDRESLSSLTGALGQTLGIMLQRGSREQKATLRPEDVLIEPDVRQIGVLSFTKVVEAMEVGRASVTGAVRERIEALAAGRPPIGERAVAVAVDQRRIRYDRLVLENGGGLSDAVVLSRLDLPPEGEIDLATLRARLSKVYGLDLFEAVTYRIERNGAETDLVVVADPKRTGPIELRFGVGVQDDFDGEGAITVAFGSSVTQLTPMGARVDVDAALGSLTGLRLRGEQPLNVAHTWFLRPTLFYTEQTAPLYPRPDERVADLQVRRVSAELAALWTPTDTYRIGASLGYFLSSVDVKTGDPNLSSDLGVSDDFEGGPRIGFSFDYDSLDDPDLPRSGGQLFANLGLDAFGDDDVSDGDIAIDALAAHSFGRFTLSPFLVAEGEIGADNDLARPSFIGGFQRLSGYADRERLGAVVGLAGLRFYRRIDLESLFGDEAFFGGSAEYGGAWSNWDAIDVEGAELAGSIFAGVQTGFGPLVLGFGVGEAGQFAGHFSLGQRF